ncbi:UNVERIFIED_ORG: hypothetical protein QOE_1496 [Clostridioides difficile F501]|nr:hypothetical protein HMPREF9404_4951 [Eggerthella sp. HGA1]
MFLAEATFTALALSSEPPQSLSDRLRASSLETNLSNAKTPEQHQATLRDVAKVSYFDTIET